MENLILVLGIILQGLLSLFLLIVASFIVTFVVHVINDSWNDPLEEIKELEKLPKIVVYGFLSIISFIMLCLAATCLHYSFVFAKGLL